MFAAMTFTLAKPSSSCGCSRPCTSKRLLSPADELLPLRRLDEQIPTGGRQQPHGERREHLIDLVVIQMVTNVHDLAVIDRLQHRVVIVPRMHMEQIAKRGACLRSLQPDWDMALAGDFLIHDQVPLTFVPPVRDHLERGVRDDQQIALAVRRSSRYFVIRRLRFRPFWGC